MIARFERTVAGKADTVEQIEALADHQAQDNLCVSGSSEGVTAASLQERERALAEANGVAVASLQPMPAAARGAFSRVTVRVAINGTLESLFGLLHDLEGGHPLVFVENLEVKAAPYPWDRDPATVDPQLTVRFDVSGYLQPEAG
jgi:general secretion pathway protein M